MIKYCKFFAQNLFIHEESCVLACFYLFTFFATVYFNEEKPRIGK